MTTISRFWIFWGQGFFIFDERTFCLSQRYKFGACGNRIGTRFWPGFASIPSICVTCPVSSCTTKLTRFAKKRILVLSRFEFLYWACFGFLLFSGKRNYAIVNLNSRKDSWYQDNRNVIGVSKAKGEGKFVLLELAFLSTLGGPVCNFFLAPVKTGWLR